MPVEREVQAAQASPDGQRSSGQTLGNREPLPSRHQSHLTAGWDADLEPHRRLLWPVGRWLDHLDPQRCLGLILARGLGLGLVGAGACGRNTLAGVAMFSAWWGRWWL